MTGNTPGMPRQMGQVCVLGGAPKVVLQPQNIFDWVNSSAWTSKPMTASYSGMVTPRGKEKPVTSDEQSALALAPRRSKKAER